MQIMSTRTLLAALYILTLTILALGYWISRSRTIFGRSKRRILLSLPHLPLVVWYACKAAMQVKAPLSFLWHYLWRTPPPGRIVEFRDGLKIHLSDSHDDLITVLVVLVRRDYGRLPSGGIVVDIGANIGVFCIDAARQGARQVYAFEPNGESIELLRRNAAVNGFSSKIHACQLAVTDRGGMKATVPLKSDPCNRIDDCEGGEFERVDTISLAEIIDRFLLDRIDLLKVDCEGAEYSILLNAPDWVWDHIREIRLEYHQGRVCDLTGHLTERGFRLDLATPPATKEVGTLQFSNIRWTAATRRLTVNPPSQLSR